MNPRARILWVSALRSGEYVQCRDNLQQDDKFCVLGVLREVYRKLVGDPFLDRDSSTLLGATTQKWAGLQSQATRDSIMDMNDGQELSFEQIAKYIEDHL